MITALVGAALYVGLHCMANNLHPIDYIRTHWMMLGLVVVALSILTMMPAAAGAAVVTGLAMPYLAAYSLPSIFAKVGQVIKELKSYFNG